MRDAAAAAAMSDPENNRWFRRRWSDTQEQCAAPPVLDNVHAPETPVFATAAEQALDHVGRELLDLWRRERAAKGAAR